LSGSNPGIIKETIFSDQAAEMALDDLLHLDEETKSMLELT
jgi:hypothetical protein